MHLTGALTFTKYVTQFAKTRHIFGNPEFCTSEFYIPKALFYSNTNAVLQILFELQGQIAREAIHWLYTYFYSDYITRI